MKQVAVRENRVTVRTMETPVTVQTTETQIAIRDQWVMMKPPVKKKKLSPWLKNVNVSLLAEVQRVILADSRRVNMGGWIETNVLGLDRPPECGMVACLGGWGLVLSKRPEGEGQFKQIGWQAQNSTPDPSIPLSIAQQAQRVLGLSDQQANILFYVTGWPEKFGTRISKYRPGTPAYARTVNARVNHFLKTGK